MTTPMNVGRHQETERRRQRVRAALTSAARDGTVLTVSAIARTARVDRTFFYRHRDLLEELHTAAREPTGPTPGHGPTVTQVSLHADLANAGARAARLAARVQQLEKRLSHVLGEQAWRESGLGAPADIDEHRRTITQLEQQNVELASRLEEQEGELEAARAANRELTRALNQRG
ncbi:DUF6262 family protein [Streptomyces sp. DSM 41527]|uniref:DUF6262 family protein n=1 Tax=Streptomyces mooreae TaxID=3075523 RepID=A0ABU2TE25_9ACTN|nr:DUF6262 family protein [Streptomyces sp. DSM 41527]MDT0459201.1 DUF6262 family protein [Streptomyces sp. DSM 41527]